MIGLSPDRLDAIAVVGAHCDDIAIGMGGTLLTLARAHPGLSVHALVLTGAGTPRQAEEAAALEAFAPGARLELTVLDLPDGRTPAHWGEVKSGLRAFRETAADVDAVFAPRRDDAHQDHRLLAELVPTEFRDHLTLRYEIPKWETDTPTPDVLHPLTDEIAREKTALLHAHYPSQESRDWFDDDVFLGLARLRGMQCRTRYAEGFGVDKMILRLHGSAE
ncbi:GlcNAc-PI de-N-acetylase [Gordonia spumicola]|uniref:GlcNAc-PI de-N-acetylase n=1 Tax=Gordonia spumicola TaxID=589161 RepID=A0A7I9V534_9ACTN|nr:PIG-L family deacetylase [Gordonia spumicola]GEE00357.1 GlcNAc-PI de-N-acetylase [Gordonia spumicola]